MEYKVQLKTFSGPLYKLLELIEERKLEITQVSLSDVTADFIDYIREIGAEVDPLVLSDFLVVAAKLMLIKSKVLLPSLELTDEEESEIHDLETRLKIYKEFKHASAHIVREWSDMSKMYSRQLLSHFGETTAFYPPPGLRQEHIQKSLVHLVEGLQEFLKKPETLKKAVITVEQKIKEIVSRLKTSAGNSFKDISKGQPRSEVIVVFLALLQLLKDRFLHVEQGVQFGDILLEKSKTK